MLLVGTRDERLAVGKELGVDLIANTKDPESPDYVEDLAQFIQDNNDGGLSNRTILATSNLGAIKSGIDTAGPASTVVIFGLPGDATSTASAESSACSRT